MAYRETAKTRAKADERRTRIEQAARHVIARGGIAAASIASVAREAGCSSGLIYTYYSSRDELLRVVFARAAGHELAVVEAAVESASNAADIVDSVVEVFVRRAVTGRTLAYALLLEAVPESVQIERMALRRGYVAAIASGIEGRYQTTTSAEVAARALVGSIAENLVDVLDPAKEPPSVSAVEALITELSVFARTAIGEQ
ncbi:TetR/AcrR family transcriptional regulator [Brevibacterium sp. ZH18]|uniref:TetR/AcrR family transcriptional regulator n=1 Tax=Brevibacterium sp. ZH18 TaxID=2927784 RepID=UPI001F6199CB|nr:TetR/AcrR family transcriptional regulator [Brevibacterium sp. ZH18]